VLYEKGVQVRDAVEGAALEIGKASQTPGRPLPMSMCQR
jgi:hypothetical protein